MTKQITALMLAVLMVLSLAGCFGSPEPTEPSTQPTTEPVTEPTTEPTTESTTEPVVEYAGVVYLTVNPSFAIYYNEAGEVVKVEALNDDAAALDVDADSFQGSSCADVLADLVEVIGEAGYLDEEDAQIEISVEAAEGVEPDETLETTLYTELTAEVHAVLTQNEWVATVTVEMDGEIVEPTEPATEPTMEPTTPPVGPTEPGHKHNYKVVDTVEATCTHGTYDVYECTTCGDRYDGEATGKFGHSFESRIVHPTMGTDGYTEYTCSKCGESYRDSYTAKLEVTFTDVNETVYTTGAVNVRSNPTTNSDVVTTLEYGASVTRTGIGSNGWSRVIVNGETAYIYSDYLSKTAPSEDEPNNGNEGGNTGGNDYTGGNGNEGEEYDPWDDYVHDADPYGYIDGLSWDGKSPIIYTYPDGTQSTVPMDGATYEKYPGKFVTYRPPLEDNRTEQEKEDNENGIFYCNYCGRIMGDGSNGTCVRPLVGGRYCEAGCGQWCEPQVCHTCPD